jgi:hypothetical protein
MTDPKELMKWTAIRARRDEMLRRLVDPVLPQMVYNDLPEEQASSIKQLRRRLLDLPQEIQAKIDSGELESVLKYKFNELELLGLSDQSGSINSGEK